MLRPEAPRPPLLARLLSCLLLVISALSLSAYGAPGANPTQEDADRLTEAELGQVRSAAAPLVTARSAALVDMDTGRVLWQRRGNSTLPMASTVKMMTALLALDYAEPDEVATVWPRDLVGGSTMYLRAGEQMTIENLLHGALIASGNDAAVTIADHVGREHLGGVGDQGIEVFVDGMNERAERIGLRRTQFRNPNGYDDPGQYSSPLDLITIAREVLAHPLLSEIVATPRTRVVGYVGEGRERSPLYHELISTNELLGRYPGANGVKTGTTLRAGEVLVASARRGNRGLIASVMGATERFSDVTALFDWAYARYRWLPASAPYFLSDESVPVPEPVYIAAQRWNTDLTFVEAGDGAPRYWLGTEPIELPDAAADTP